MVHFLNFKDTVNLSERVNISGLINGPTLTFYYVKGVTQIRVPVILPCRTQILLEIWSQGVGMKPQFAKDWKILQMITIFDLSYGGETNIEGHVYKVFRLNYKWQHKFGRFVWLSTESERFWYQPISKLDDHVDLKKLSLESWPHRVPFGSGTLRMSKGSKISRHWGMLYPTWNTNEYESFTFEDICRLQEVTRRGVFGYINLATRQPMNAKYNFSRYLLKYYHGKNLSQN